MTRERRKGEPQPIHDVLPGVLRGLKGAAAGGALERVRRAWAEAVGPAVAARTRVAALDGGRVRVDVASAALKHDLSTFRRGEVLEALRAKVPDLRIQGVQYRVSSLS